MTVRASMATDVAVIILTYNEAENLSHALKSVRGWARQICVLDSLSNDGTLEIAHESGCVIAQNPFVDYSKQRNYALDHLPIDAEWILFLDADERLTDELRREISAVVSRSPAEDGFYIKRRMMWMGKWIRRGYYPTWLLRLFRRGKGRCEERAMNEHIVVDGKIGYLMNDFIHDDCKGVDEWIVKHSRYATWEAMELIKWERTPNKGEIAARLTGNQAERKRWIRNRVWNRMPPLMRPFVYFFYRYLFRGGFLDGKAAFVFHFLQALWYPLLIDIKYLELKAKGSANADSLSEGMPRNPNQTPGNC